MEDKDFAEEKATDENEAVQTAEKADDMGGYVDQDINDEEYMASLRERVDLALDEIRNILAMDGGGIDLVEITDDMTAKVRLMGHCAGCMGARMTMSGIVESILQDEVPEIKAVEAVD